MTRSAIFRADGSGQIGSGHIMRCRAIADFLQRAGWHCGYAVTRQTFDTVFAGMAPPHDVLLLENESWDDPTALAAQLETGCDLLVVDHYGLGKDYEAASRRWATRILAIDDLADRHHDCDFLLDPGSEDSRATYDQMTPQGCDLLLGPAYAPLAQRYVEMRAKVLPRELSSTAPRLLVNFGAADPTNAVSQALETLDEVAPEVKVDIVLGPAAPHLNEIRERVGRVRERIQLHVGTDDMPDLIAVAGLAIGAGGVSAWERCCLGMPSILAATADNQVQTIEAISAAGAATRVELSERQLAEALTRLLSDSEARQEMSVKAAALCDGRGLYRIGMRLEADIAAKDGEPVTLRPARKADSAIMLQWQSHPVTRRFSHNSEPPNSEAHHRWVAERLLDPDCLFNIVEHRGVPAGVVRLDRRPVDGRAEERMLVSILTAPEKHGVGIGNAALALARLLAPEAQFKAEVLPDNKASHALFKKAGYQWRRDAYYADPEIGRHEA